MAREAWQGCGEFGLRGLCRLCCGLAPRAGVQGTRLELIVDEGVVEEIVLPQAVHLLRGERDGVLGVVIGVDEHDLGVAALGGEPPAASTAGQLAAGAMRSAVAAAASGSARATRLWRARGVWQLLLPGAGRLATPSPPGLLLGGSSPHALRAARHVLQRLASGGPRRLSTALAQIGRDLLSAPRRLQSTHDHPRPDELPMPLEPFGELDDLGGPGDVRCLVRLEVVLDEDRRLRLGPIAEWLPFVAELM